MSFFGIRIRAKDCFVILFLSLSFLFTIFAYGQNLFTYMLIADLISLTLNMFFCFQKKEERFLLLIFNLTIFLFLLGRPFVALIRNENWWGVSSIDGMNKALLSIQIVLLLLPVGAVIVKKTKGKCNIIEIEEKYGVLEKVKFAAFVIFLLGLIGATADGLQKISYMAFHSYVEYYVDYSSNLPFILKAFVRMLKPSMCLYLATFPSKKMSFLVIGGYIITTVPYMIVGMRSPTLLACLFALSYFLLREYMYPNQEKWIGKKEKLCILIALPCLIAFAYSYNYIRQGKSYTVDKDVFLNFLYQQGISFQYLAQGFDVLDSLPVKGLPGYMLGPSYDNIVYGSAIGRAIFRTPVISNQSMDAIMIGHDMKQHLSYALMGNSYLLGYGSGANFVLEVIHDLGWIGLGGYAIFMGSFCVKIVDLFLSPKLIRNTIIIYSLLQLYYIARSDALYFLEHIVNPYFWITIIIILLLSRVVKKKTFLFNKSLL